MYVTQTPIKKNCGQDHTQKGDAIEMSKIYQPIKNNPYRLRDSVYPYIVWAIRDVARISKGYFDDDFMQAYRPPQTHVEAVNTALQEIPEEYRQVIYDNVAFEKALPAGYRGKTTTLIKARFIYRVAELLDRPLGAKEITHVEYDWR